MLVTVHIFMTTILGSMISKLEISVYISIYFCKTLYLTALIFTSNSLVSLDASRVHFCRRNSCHNSSEINILTLKNKWTLHLEVEIAIEKIIKFGQN
jgi:hypothetical protein